MRLGSLRARGLVLAARVGLERPDGRRPREERRNDDRRSREPVCAGRFVSARRSERFRSKSPILCTLLNTATVVLLAGCVPLPTSPSTHSARVTPREAHSPAPRYEELEFPDTPPLDAGGVEFRTATGPGDLWGTSQPEPASARNEFDLGSGSPPAPLDERLQLSRRGEGLSVGESSGVRRIEDRVRVGSGDLPPTVRIDTIPRGSSRSGALEGRSLRGRRDHLLGELALYRGRDERDLGDGERLAKHRVQVQLMALHFLLDATDSSHLEPLIDSLRYSHEPSREHALLVASFYESVDFEQKSAEILTRLAGLSAAEVPALRSTSFRIAPPVLCTRIDGLGRYRVVERQTFRPGTELRLYVEIFGIENAEAAGKYRQRLEVAFSLVDRDGMNRGSQTSRTEGPAADEPLVDSFLNLRYSIPREVPYGKAKLEVTVRDLISGAVSRQTVDLRIEP